MIRQESLKKLRKARKRLRGWVKQEMILKKSSFTIDAYHPSHMFILAIHSIKQNKSFMLRPFRFKQGSK